MHPDHQFDIIDAHQHYGDVHHAVSGFSSDLLDASGEASERELETRLRILDRQNVRQSLIFPAHSYLRPNGILDTRRVNDAVARYCDNRPDRFPAGIGVSEPLYGREGLGEIDRCKTELGFVGISFHVRFQGVSLDSPWVHSYIQRIAENGLTPFIHSFGQSVEESLWKVSRLATSFSDLKMVILDVFADPEQSRQVLDVGTQHPNLYFDTALALSFEMLVEPAIRALGESRFVYGSDTYSWPVTTRPSRLLDEILTSPFSDSTKAAILGGNLRSILGLDGDVPSR